MCSESKRYDFWPGLACIEFINPFHFCCTYVEERYKYTVNEQGGVQQTDKDTK